VNFLLPGMYVAGESALHKLDPRVKTGAALLLMSLPFIAQSLGGHLLLLTFVATLVFVSGIPLLALLRTLQTIFWIGLFLFLFYLFTTPGQPLLGLGSVVLSWEGLVAGSIQVYRLSLLVIIATLTTFTTSPTQLAHGLEATLRPLERIGLPVRELVMVLTIALSSVPLSFLEIEKISKAQRARGSDFRSGGPWHRIRSLTPVLVPIFVSAFRRAEELATAMEARNFRSAPQRTRMYQLRLKRADLVASLIVLAVSIAVLGPGQLV
jgi:energy-coupling factor transport system permease protein